MTKNIFPRISIVTVVFNSQDFIQETIVSCIEQTYSNLEYIIIDGKSTDNTVSIINKYITNISCFISEPDNGIYDAMNKAIKIATGDWIIFMNSGDKFYNKEVLSTIFNNDLNYKDENIDIIYGNTLFKINNSYLVSKPMDLNLIEREMIFCHQSSFVKREIAIQHLFDLKYKLAADYEMIYYFFQHEKRFKYVDLLIAIFDQDEGSTLRNYKQSTRERYSIHSDAGSIKNSFLMYKTILRIQFSLIVKMILPKRIRDSIFFYKNKNIIFKD
jgi:glycosyltransferase involved in cell wall biosynthesis